MPAGTRKPETNPNRLSDRPAITSAAAMVLTLHSPARSRRPRKERTQSGPPRVGEAPHPAAPNGTRMAPAARRQKVTRPSVPENPLVTEEV